MKKNVRSFSLAISLLSVMISFSNSDSDDYTNYGTTYIELDRNGQPNYNNYHRSYKQYNEIYAGTDLLRFLSQNDLLELQEMVLGVIRVLNINEPYKSDILSKIGAIKTLAYSKTIYYNGRLIDYLHISDLIINDYRLDILFNKIINNKSLSDSTFLLNKYFYNNIIAMTIKLNSGKQFAGTIVNDTGEYIILNVEGSHIPILKTIIDTICSTTDTLNLVDEKYENKGTVKTTLFRDENQIKFVAQHENGNESNGNVIGFEDKGTWVHFEKLTHDGNGNLVLPSLPKSIEFQQTIADINPCIEQKTAISSPSIIKNISADTLKDASIFIVSIPPIADVYIDGALIGKTNVAELSVKPGKHIVKFIKGNYSVVDTMFFKEGKNPSAFIKFPKKE